MRVTNKHKEVLKHLQTHGSITSMEAIQLYGATRLAAIIFDLRGKYDIDTIMMDDIDRYGNTCKYGKYVYKGVKIQERF